MTWKIRIEYKRCTLRIRDSRRDRVGRRSPATEVCEEDEGGEVKRCGEQR